MTVKFKPSSPFSRCGKFASVEVIIVPIVKTARTTENKYVCGLHISTHILKCLALLHHVCYNTSYALQQRSAAQFIRLRINTLGQYKNRGTISIRLKGVAFDQAKLHIIYFAVFTWLMRKIHHPIRPFSKSMLRTYVTENCKGHLFWARLIWKQEYGLC